MRQFPHRGATHPEGRAQPLTTVQLCQTADGSLTLLDAESGQSYRSMHGAMTESRLVFLDNSGLAARLQARRPSSALEIGFGSGLNFCLTALHAIEQRCELHYCAYENALPPVALIETVLRHNLPRAQPLLDPLLALLARSSPDMLRGRFCGWIDFELRLSDARDAQWPASQFDAIYLDAFSASRNPQLWQRQFLKRLAPALRERGRLATFGVNGAFRQALETAGLHWKKRPGPPGKREVLVASRCAAAL